MRMSKSFFAAFKFYRFYFGVQASDDIWCNNGCRRYSKKPPSQNKAVAHGISTCNNLVSTLRVEHCVSNGDRAFSASRRVGNVDPPRMLRSSGAAYIADIMIG